MVGRRWGVSLESESGYVPWRRRWTVAFVFDKERFVCPLPGQGLKYMSSTGSGSPVWRTSTRGNCRLALWGRDGGRCVQSGCKEEVRFVVWPHTCAAFWAARCGTRKKSRRLGAGGGVGAICGLIRRGQESSSWASSMASMPRSSGIIFSSLPRALTEWRLPFWSTTKSAGMELMPHEVENSLAQPLPW